MVPLARRHHVLDHAGDLPAQVKALGLRVPHVFGINRTDAHWDAICELLAPSAWSA